MILIKDLGMIEYGTKGRKQKYGIYKCPVCNHNFKCSTSHVNSGHTTKCRECAKLLNAKVKSQKVSNTFIEDCGFIHNYKYNYDLVEYINSYTKIKIICPEHGEFSQYPLHHKNGHGCHKCSSELLPSHKLLNAKLNFSHDSAIVHNNKYDYTFVDYIHSKLLVKIICPDHGEFYQTPNDHKSGCGCPSCSKSGFDKTKNAILYYLEIYHCDNIYYKIGVTNHNIQKRFTKSDLSKIKVISIEYFNNGIDAYNTEQLILNKYKEFRYVGDPILSSGNTEIFTHDVLNPLVKN